MKLHSRLTAEKVLIYGGAALACLICLFPFYYAIVTSLRGGQALFQVAYLPDGLHWDNYRNALLENGMARSLFNSLLVATLTVGLCLLVSITAAFALARIPFRGRKFLLFTISPRP